MCLILISFDDDDVLFISHHIILITIISLNCPNILHADTAAESMEFLKRH